jgi:hypothetical protein
VIFPYLRRGISKQIAGLLSTRKPGTWNAQRGGNYPRGISLNAWTVVSTVLRISVNVKRLTVAVDINPDATGQTGVFTFTLIQ